MGLDSTGDVIKRTLLQRCGEGAGYQRYEDRYEDRECKHGELERYGREI